MRQEFVKTSSRYMALKACPWSSRITKVVGGFLCFECETEFKIFKGQV